MDGYELTAHLRKLVPAERTAVLLLSSSLASCEKFPEEQLKIGRKLSKPIRRAELHEAIAYLLAKTIPNAKKSEVPAEHGENLRLLLVEDNPVNQKLAKRLLEKMGHGVTLAENGKEAVDKAVSGAFDLVLMDLQMPVMGGLEATKQIRENDAK